LWLLASALFLPIVIVLILTVGRLLGALEDPVGAAAFDRIALGLGVVWVLAIIGMPLVLAVQTLSDEPAADEEHE
jgi:Na+-translocating ferredoxin:NAD+ oxidoreductase RnfE subunit